MLKRRATGLYKARSSSRWSQFSHVHRSSQVARLLVLSSLLTPLSPVAEFLHQHPPGVADIAFREDVEAVMVGRSRTVPKSYNQFSTHRVEDASSGAKLRPGVPSRIL